MYHVNVSSMQEFAQCRFRWWCKYVMNRVPVAESPALDAGKLLHRIFERHFSGTCSLVQAASLECAAYREMIALAHSTAQTSALKALSLIEDLAEALPLWEEKFPIDEVLEVEQSFEMQDEENDDLIWLGRPDRIVRIGRGIWHTQNRGLAASMNFGTYTRLGNRHYHEHLYAEAMSKKYCTGKKKLKYEGVIFNLVRKLKFRTNVGKKNEATKTAAEMFWQGPLNIDLNGPIHRGVMHTMRQHAEDMLWCQRKWEDDEYIPPSNDKMNGGFSGSCEDPYFRVLIGEVQLDDDSVFKNRELMYEVADASSE